MSKVINIPVKQFGISKVIIVRTKKNGGIKVTRIAVSFE